MAAALLADACARRSLAVSVSSAGFLFDGYPASDTTTAVMRERGIDLRAHRSRIVTAELIADADLVLTMERRHARDLVVQFEHAEIVHTLKGFATIVTAPSLAGDSAVDAPSLVRAAAAARTPVALLGDGGPDEVADPHGRSARMHRRAADDIGAAVDAIAAAFVAAIAHRSV